MLLYCTSDGSNRWVIAALKHTVERQCSWTSCNRLKNIKWKQEELVALHYRQPARDATDSASILICALGFYPISGYSGFTTNSCQGPLMAFHQVQVHFLVRVRCFASTRWILQLLWRLRWGMLGEAVKLKYSENLLDFSALDSVNLLRREVASSAHFLQAKTWGSSIKAPCIWQPNV